MNIYGIVAINEVDCIGLNGKLPWAIPEEIAFFKRKTLHSIVVMGRKTFESIGGPLRNRINVVLSKNREISRNLKEKFPNVYILSDTSPTDVLTELHLICKMHENNEVYICGGLEVYTLFQNVITTWYVSNIYNSISGDMYYPYLRSSQFLQEFNLTEVVMVSEEFSTYKFFRKTLW